MQSALPVVALDCEEEYRVFDATVARNAMHPRWLLRMSTTGLFVGSDNPAMLQTLEDYIGPKLLAKVLYVSDYKGVLSVITLPTLTCNEALLLEAVAAMQCGCNCRIAMLPDEHLPEVAHVYGRPVSLALLTSTQ